MRLTKFSDYSLRVLMYLAIIPENELATIPEIAAKYNISENHIRVAVHQLGKLGYLNCTRGKGGGISLALNPIDISIGEVIRETESDFQLVDCFNPQGNCTIFGACKLQHVLADALNAFLETLDQYTLADIIQNKKSLAKLLQLT